VVTALTQHQKEKKKGQRAWNICGNLDVVARFKAGGTRPRVLALWDWTGGGEAFVAGSEGVLGERGLEARLPGNGTETPSYGFPKSGMLGKIGKAGPLVANGYSMPPACRGPGLALGGVIMRSRDASPMGGAGVGRRRSYKTDAPANTILGAQRVRHAAYDAGRGFNSVPGYVKTPPRQPRKRKKETERKNWRIGY